eukprot:4833880-Pleurochrysis_carterae.AAC.9
MPLTFHLHARTTRTSTAALTKIVASSMLALHASCDGLAPARSLFPTVRAFNVRLPGRNCGCTWPGRYSQLKQLNAHGHTYDGECVLASCIRFYNKKWSRRPTSVNGAANSFASRIAAITGKWRSAGK